MKKYTILIVIVLICVLMISVAAAAVVPPDGVNKSQNYVIFGAYEQWNRKEYIGTGNISDTLFINNGIEPIEWIVLKQDDTKLLLLSRNPIEYRQFSKERKKGTWRSSDIRLWLNNTFITTAFTQNEQNAIVSTEIQTGGGAVEKNWYDAPVEKTLDKVLASPNLERRKRLTHKIVNSESDLLTA